MNPFDQFDAQDPAPQPQSNPFDQFDALAPSGALKDARPSQAHTYSVLPISEDEQGNPHFDINAGVLGSIKRAVTLPGDVYTGKTDPQSDEALRRSFEFATVASPVNPAIRAGGRAVPGSLRATRPGETPVPSAEVLRSAADTGYDQARQMGVDYSAPAVAELAKSLRLGLEKDGILAELAPKSFSILRKLEGAPPDGVAPLSGLEAARRAFGHAAKDFANPTEQLAATRISEGLDNFVANPDPSVVVAGPADAAAKVLADARGNYAAAKRSDRITGIEDAADLRAAAANSGQNIDNAIRQRVASLLLNPKARAGFSPEEIAALEEVAKGTPSRNAARIIGNLLGGGGGLGSVVTSMAGAGAGGAAAGPVGAFVGAAAPALGYGSKTLANALTSRALESADTLVRQRSPLFNLMKEKTPPEIIGPERRAAIIRGLLLAQQSTSEKPGERASGGRVSKRDYPAKRASRLEKQAARARKALGGQLAPLMNVPDDVVATALRVARQ